LLFNFIVHLELFLLAFLAKFISFSKFKSGEEVEGFAASLAVIVRFIHLFLLSSAI